MSPRVAVTAIFALNGSLFASLFSRFPAIQDEAGLSEGRLGLALLCSMAGLLVSQPLAGALTSRHGSRPLVLAGALGYSLGLVPIAFADSFAALCLAFAFIGFASGVLDVSMNVQGLTVERPLGRPVLASLHAAFSFGALGGAAAGGVVAGMGVSVPAHLCSAAALGMAVALVTNVRLMPREADAAPEGALLARPTRALAALGALGFCVLLAEGAVNDWTAIYLDDIVGTGEGLAAAGLAIFSLTMGVGRLTGDRVTEAIGPVTQVRAGGLLAAAGMGLALAAPSAPVALAGFAAIGLGLAALFPVTLRAAADRGESAGPAVAAVSAMGYLGFLAGPPAIGGLAELAGLGTALVLVVALCVAAALLAPAAGTRGNPSATR